jgi:hypothetical protein
MTDMNRNEKNPMSQGNDPKRDDARDPNAPQREQGSQNRDPQRDLIGKPHQGGAPRSEPAQPGHNAGLGHESDDTNRGAGRATDAQGLGQKPSQGLNVDRGDAKRGERGPDATRKSGATGEAKEKDDETCCEE